MGSYSSKTSVVNTDDSVNSVGAQDQAVAVGRGASYVDHDLNQGGLNSGIISYGSTINAALDPATAGFLSSQSQSVNDIIQTQTAAFEKSFDSLLDYASGIKTPGSAAIGLNIKQSPLWILAAIAAVFFMIKGKR